MSARKRGEGVQEGERERQDRPFRDLPPPRSCFLHWASLPMACEISFLIYSVSLSSAIGYGPNLQHFIILACRVGLGSENVSVH